MEVEALVAVFVALAEAAAGPGFAVGLVVVRSVPVVLGSAEEVEVDVVRL